MAKFEFPQNPGTQRENPFQDDSGANPFSDGTPPPAEAEAVTDNAFAAPAASTERPYTPGDYEAILVPNASGALRLAIFAFGLSGLGVVGAGIAIAASGTWTTPLFFILSLQFAALATGLPACIIARRDLRAIKAGAMTDEGRGKSRLAFWIGAIAVLLGSAPIVLYIVLLVILLVTQ